MREIIVGFGVHAHSTRALDWATRLAKRQGARVTVFNAFHPASFEMSSEAYTDELEQRHHAIKAIMGEIGQTDFAVVVRMGEAAEELMRYAESSPTDLVVVGCHGSTAHGGFGERGASDRLLRHCRIPLVVVGDQATLPSTDRPLTIVVGVDGSSANADSVQAIGVLAKDIGARTIPVLSVDTGASTTRDNHGSHLLHRADRLATADRLPKTAPSAAVDDSSVQVLLDAATEWDADLIAVGTWGDRAPIDLVDDQVARHLIDHSSRPVLVCPHP